MEKLIFEILKVRLHRAASALKDDPVTGGEISGRQEVSSIFGQVEQWIRRTEDTQSELEEAQKKLGEIASLQNKIQQTWRWRIGNWVINTLNMVMFRKESKTTAFEKLDRLLENIKDSLEGMEKSFQPYKFSLFGDQMAGPAQFPPVGSVRKGKVAYIILNRNGADHLEKLFSSFIKWNTYGNYEFILIDHHSNDRSIKVIGEYRDKIDIKLFQFPMNLTFSYSNNFAACQTDAEFLFLLNNDIIFDQDVTGNLLRMFEERHDAGIVAPVLYYPDEQFRRSDSVQHAGIKFAFNQKRDDHISFQPTDPPSFMVLEYKYSHLFRDAILPYNVQELPVSNAEVQAICAAAMVCRREDFFNAGGFDENYIYGYEDVDLSLVFITKLKRKLLIVNDLGMIHNESFTRKKEGLYKASLKIHNMLVLQFRFGYYMKVNFLKDHYPGEAIRGQQEGGAEKELAKLHGDRLNVSVKWPAADIDTAHLAEMIPVPLFHEEGLQDPGFHFRIDPEDKWYEQGIMMDDIVISFTGKQVYYPQPGQINVLWVLPGPGITNHAILFFYDLVVYHDTAPESGLAELKRFYKGKIVQPGSITKEFLTIHHEKAGL